MSVIVKGMDMPKNCNDCLINCEHSLLYVGITDERHPDCPLIELPFAEELAEKLYKQIEKAVIEGSETDA